MCVLRTCSFCFRRHISGIGAGIRLFDRHIAPGISTELPHNSAPDPRYFLIPNQKVSTVVKSHAVNISHGSRSQILNAKDFSSALYTPLSEADHAPFVLKPEIDFEGVFQDVGELEKNLEVRGHKVDVSNLLSLWERLQSLEQEKSHIEERRSKVNEDIKQMKKKGGVKEQTSELQQLGKLLREELRHVNSSIASVSDEFYPVALKLPNKLHSAVPQGTTPRILETFGLEREENLKTSKSEEITERSFMTQSHPMCHAGYPYLDHNAALTELALTRWATQELLHLGFTPFTSPAMYKTIALESLGLDPENNNETYAIETHDTVQYLAGVSPMNFIAYFMMSVLEVADLPCRCFTVGRGYNNRPESATFEGLHKSFQTQKVELCGVCENTEAASNAVFTQFLSAAKGLLSNLPLHYRIVEVPSAHLLPSMYRKCAIEVWIPDAGIFSEVASVSSCTDYISRRVKIRYPAVPSQTAAQSRTRNFPYTVHCTLLDTSVILAALLPYVNQQLPDVLKPHMPRAVSS